MESQQDTDTSGGDHFGSQSLVTNTETPDGGAPTTGEKEQGFASRFTVPSGVGSPINDDIPNSLAFLMKEKLEDKHISNTADKYQCPSNCEVLVIPKVNPQIWDNITVKGLEVTENSKAPC